MKGVLTRSQVCSHMLVTPELRRLREEDLKFEGSLVTK